MHLHVLLKQSNRQNIFDNATSNLNASPTNGFSVVLSELRVIFVGFPFSSSLKLIQPSGNTIRDFMIYYNFFGKLIMCITYVHVD